MEKRLRLAKRLLKPEDSALVVTIDEHEYLRLGLLLNQLFPEARIQMVSSVVSPKGSARQGAFSRCDEYIFFVLFGEAAVGTHTTDMLRATGEEKSSALDVRWGRLLRRGADGHRDRSPDSLFYPIFFDAKSGHFIGIGDSVPKSKPIETVRVPEGAVAMWPLDASGNEMRWMISADTFRSLHSRGFVRFGRWAPGSVARTPYYLQSGVLSAIEDGTVQILGYDVEGAAQLRYKEERLRKPMTVWNLSSHSAADFGSKTVTALIKDRVFPFPKSLYAVEDTLRFLVADKPNAVVLDFFSGFRVIIVIEANFSEPENKYIAEITDNIKTHYNIEISISNK